MSGRFIVLDGPDGSGTTRHSQFLAERLEREGYPVLCTAEPTNGPMGTHIRSILTEDSSPPPDAVQLLFCADRAEHVAQVLLPALEAGTHVVCDRYSLSTVVYGAAQDVDADWLRQINARFPVPDLTILALPPPEVCLERLGRRPRQDQFEREDFVRKTHELYTQLAGPSDLVVDTSGSKSQTAERIWNAVKPLL